MQNHIDIHSTTLSGMHHLPESVVHFRYLFSGILLDRLVSIGYPHDIFAHNPKQKKMSWES